MNVGLFKASLRPTFFPYFCGGGALIVVNVMKQFLVSWHVPNEYNDQRFKSFLTKKGVKIIALLPKPERLRLLLKRRLNFHFCGGKRMF